MIYSNILLVILVSFVCHIQGQSQCITPTNRKGTCIPIKNCSQLLALVTNPQKTNEQLQLLKDSQCGIDALSSPMVCCATEEAVDGRCITPEGIEGSCIDIKLCPILKKLLNPPASKRNMNYVRNHRCDETDENRVCCINCQKVLGPPHMNTGCCGIDKFGVKPDPDTVVTSIYQYPWMVLIEYEKPHNKIELNCGGVLISSKYVLTAAHCFKGLNIKPTPKSVRFGEYDTTWDGPDCEDVGDNQVCTDGAISIPIESIHLHHHYDVRVSRHDIALLRLQHDMDYTDFIRPICLPTTDVEENEPHTFYVVGYGQVNETNIKSNKKLHVDLPFVPLEECNKHYKAGNRIIWEGHICAGGVLGRSTCRGDSGGPLMSYNEYYELIGLVSFGQRCGIQNAPNVFSKVYHYLPWIRSQIKP